MKSVRIRKLQFRSETVRRLNANDLAQVLGGVATEPRPTSVNPTNPDYTRAATQCPGDCLTPASAHQTVC